MDVCTHVTSGMNRCLGKSGSKGEFVRRITREQAVVVKDTPGAGGTFFWHYPCRLVLELDCTKRDRPQFRLVAGDSAEAERQELPSPTVRFTPGHSTEQLGPPLGKDMLNGMLRDNGAYFKDVQSSSMDPTRDKVKAAQPRGWSKGAMIPTGLI